MFKQGKSGHGWTSLRYTFKINSLWAHKHTLTHNNNHLGMLFCHCLSAILDNNASKHWFRAGHLDREISNLTKRAGLHFGPKFSWTEKTLEHWNQWCSKCKCKGKLAIFFGQRIVFSLSLFFNFSNQSTTLKNIAAKRPGHSIHTRSKSFRRRQTALLIHRKDEQILPTHRTEMPNSPTTGKSNLSFLFYAQVNWFFWSSIRFLSLKNFCCAIIPLRSTLESVLVFLFLAQIFIHWFVGNCT